MSEVQDLCGALRLARFDIGLSYGRWARALAFQSRAIFPVLPFFCAIPYSFVSAPPLFVVSVSRSLTRVRELPQA